MIRLKLWKDILQKDTALQRALKQSCPNAYAKFPEIVKKIYAKVSSEIHNPDANHIVISQRKFDSVQVCVLKVLLNLSYVKFDVV